MQPQPAVLLVAQPLTPQLFGHKGTDVFHGRHGFLSSGLGRQGSRCGLLQGRTHVGTQSRQALHGAPGPFVERQIAPVQQTGQGKGRLAEAPQGQHGADAVPALKAARQVVLTGLRHLHAARGHFFQVQVPGKIVQQGHAPGTETTGPVEKDLAIGAGGQPPLLHAQPVTPVGRRRVTAGEAGIKILHGQGPCPSHAPFRRHAAGKALKGPGQQAQDVFQPLPVPGQVFP